MPVTLGLWSLRDGTRDVQTRFRQLFQHGNSSETFGSLSSYLLSASHTSPMGQWVIAEL